MKKVNLRVAGIARQGTISQFSYLGSQAEKCLNDKSTFIGVVGNAKSDTTFKYNSFDGKSPYKCFIYFFTNKNLKGLIKPVVLKIISHQRKSKILHIRTKSNQEDNYKLAVKRKNEHPRNIVDDLTRAKKLIQRNLIHWLKVK